MLWVTPLASKNTTSIVFHFTFTSSLLSFFDCGAPKFTIRFSVAFTTDPTHTCQFFAPGINIVQQIKVSLNTFRVHIWLFARPSTLVVPQIVEALHSHVEIVFQASMHSTVGIAIQQHFQSSWIFGLNPAVSSADPAK